MDASNLVVWSVIMLTATWMASPLHAQTYQIIHHFDFNSAEGAYTTGLTRDAAGNLYGTNAYAANSKGTVFKLDATTHALTVLHTFTDTPDGALPYAPVVPDSAGNIYGTTAEGGANGFGTVFKIDPFGVETILYSFNGTDGSSPNGLIRDPAGNLYGTTRQGGRLGNSGVVFRVNKSGVEKTLYKFAGPEGGQSYGSLARDAAGNLYGTTRTVGDKFPGTVFMLAPDGTETVLHSFIGFTDGRRPMGGPVLDSAGNLFGTTESGGDFNKGTVFKIDAAGNFTVLHSFNVADGQAPRAELVLDTAGNIYGNTAQGGDVGAGVVFKLDPSGNETVLHSFVGGTDGLVPYGALLLSSDGTIFGSTCCGGILNGGTLFRIKP